MNPNDYYIHSFKQIGAQIDQINKFYQSPIADFAKRQQALYESFGTSATAAMAIQPNIVGASQLVYSPFESIMRTYHDNPAAFQTVFSQQQIHSTFELFHADPPLASWLRNFASTYQNSGITTELISSIQFEPVLKPLFNITNRIHVVSDHVELTETISTEQTAHADSHSGDTCIKKLTFSDTIPLLSFIITICTWIFPSPLSYFKPQTETIQEVSITPEQQREIAGYLADISEKLDYIITRMNDSTENVQDSDSQLSLPQSDTPTPSSATKQTHEGSDTCCNIQSPSVTE